MDRGEALARELGVRRGFVPADAGHRVIRKPLQKAPRLPRRWTRAAGRVAEDSDRFLPGQSPPVLDEGLLPEMTLLVASRVNKPLVVRVGDLVPVINSHRA